MKIEYPAGATPLDQDEIAGLLPTSISTIAELNEFEASNILRAELWALRRKRNVLSEKFIRNLHQRMFNEVWKWAGTYRRTNKNIGVDWYQVPPQLTELCANATIWIEKQVYPWVELGARFHHRLVCIHAFPNGNGRHARLMTDVLLRANNQELFTWGRNLTDSSGARQLYLDALRDADDRNFEALISFVQR